MSKHNEVVLLETRLDETGMNVYPGLGNDALFQRDSVDTVLRRRELTHQELDDGIVDGPDDGGVDAVYVFLNGELVSDESSLRIMENPVIELEVLQVKNESGFGETPLQLLIDHLPQLTALGATDDELRVEFNEKVVERFGLFRNVYLLHASRMPDLRIRIAYVSKAAQSPNKKVEAKAGRLTAALGSSFPSAELSVEFLGATELNILARARPNQVLELRLAEQPLSAELGGMIALVRLSDYIEFIRDEAGAIRETIFEENVRGYEGNTNINKGISASLGEESHEVDFWWLNNGITVIGSRVVHAQKVAQIEDPQIVNGLQTSRAIFTHFADEVFPNDDRHVLVRIIETTEDDIAAQIIKATNSQNRVPPASLRAAEPFQRSIEEYLLVRGRYYERRRNHYKNQGKRRTLIISVSELAQAVASILLAMPDWARGRPGALIRDRTYPKVFNDKMPLEVFWRCIQIMDVIETYLTETRGLGRQERSNIRYHLARVAVAAAVASSRPKPAMVVKIDAGEMIAHLDVAYDWVLEERAKIAHELDESDMGTVAKSGEFAARINSRLSRYSDKQTWPKKLDSGWVYW